MRRRTGRRTTDAPADIAAGLPPGPPDEADEPERGPLRRCLVTRERQPKEAMIRFVLGPDRTLVPDLAARLPGRGMWLSARADVVEQAARRGAFAKAARGEVHLPPDLRATIEAGLRGRLRDLVGFARRAGQAVSGWQSAREWLDAGRAGLLVQAADGSPAERARLVGHRPVPVVSPLDAAELGAPFGRDRAVHVVIARGRLATAIAAEAGRLAGLTGAGAAAEAHEVGRGAGKGGRMPGADPARPASHRAPRDAAGVAALFPDVGGAAAAGGGHAAAPAATGRGARGAAPQPKGGTARLGREARTTNGGRDGAAAGGGRAGAAKGKGRNRGRA